MDMNDALAPVLADERVQEVLRPVEFDERVRVAVAEVTRAVRGIPVIGNDDHFIVID